MCGARDVTCLVAIVTVPCVVVSVVDSDGVAEAGECSVQLLRQDKLVTQQSVRISKARVHLRDQYREGDRGGPDMQRVRQVRLPLLFDRRPFASVNQSI